MANTPVGSGTRIFATSANSLGANDPFHIVDRDGYVDIVTNINAGAYYKLYIVRNSFVNTLVIPAFQILVTSAMAYDDTAVNTLIDPRIYILNDGLEELADASMYKVMITIYLKAGDIIKYHNSFDVHYHSDVRIDNIGILPIGYS